MAYTTIDDPSAYFQVATYTGNGGSDRAIVNDGNSAMQPDWVWYKSRSHASSHITYDSSRGDGPYLKPSDAGDEGTDANMFESFDSDGFSLNGDTDGNGSGRTYVAWQWKANGGTTASNSDGSITSTVQANTDAGFSIVTYTGNGSASTIGHGLGVVPAMIIVKCRNAGSTNWTVYHKNSNATPQNYILELNNTNAAADNDRFNDTAPTSSVFSVNAGSATVNQNTNTYVAYCFADVQGYSKFGKYVGNSNDNGTFVYLGFKPRWLMIKSITETNMPWNIIDTARSTSNVMDDYFTANTTDVEGTSSTKNIDFLSNGFKCRDDNNLNFSDHTYIYMAFASSPFTTSTGIPTTAR